MSRLICSSIAVEFVFCLFCVMHYSVTFLGVQSSHRGREGELLNTFIAFLLSFDCWCFVSLPCGAVGWSLARVCAMVVAFHSHTHLLFTVIHF